MEVLRQEIRLAGKYGAKLNCGKMVLYVIGGEGVGDVSEFEGMGIRVDRSRNIWFMEAHISGDADSLYNF